MSRATSYSEWVSTPADEADQPEPTGESPTPRPHVQRLRVRRSVNFPAFLLAGAFVGFVIGGLLELLGPDPQPQAGGGVVYTAVSSFSYLAMFFALLGALVGAIVGLVLDRRG